MSKHTLPRTDGGGGGCYMLPPLRGGKQYYLAPEIHQVRPYEYDGYLADIWSIGIMLFIMITGSPPVNIARSDCERYQMVCDGKILDLLSQWSSDIPALTLSAQDLITRLLIPEPATMRLRLDEILEHPWVTNMPELLPQYKRFMRSVQCVRFYEAQIARLRVVLATTPNDQNVRQTLEHHNQKIETERANQPGFLQAYQQAKLALSSSNGGGSSSSSSSGSSGGSSSSGRRK
jgi:serine/threonine protein kinase